MRAHLVLLVSATLVAGCTNTLEEDLAACKGVTCSAGECISNGGKPECVCSAAEQALGYSCELLSTTGGEPNDTFDQASVLEPDGGPWIEALVDLPNSPQDRDLYRINPVPKTAYRFSMHAPVELQFETYVGGEGNRIGWPVGTDLSQIVRADDDAPLYASVRRYIVQGDIEYSFDVESLGLDDFSNRADDATPIAGETVGKIDYVGDVDTFAVQALQDHSYLFECLGDAGCAVGFPNGQFATAGSTGPLVFSVVGDAGSSYRVVADDLGIDVAGDYPPDAAPLTLDTTIAGRLQSPTDWDWFTFAAKGGVVYRARCTAPVEVGCRLSGNWRSYAVDAGEAIGFIKDETDQSESFGVAGNWWGDYSLSVQTYATDDVGDAVFNATTATPGDITGRIDYPNDHDQWSITTVSNAIYAISVSGAGCSVNYASCPSCIGGGAPIGVDVTGNTEGPYTLSVVESIDDFPDTFQDATPIDAGTQVSGHLDGNEQDEAVIALNPNSPYVLNASGPVLVRVIDGQTTLASGGDKWPGPHAFQTSANQTYEVQVVGAGSNECITPYTLEIDPG